MKKILLDKKAIITGGNQGLGFEIAKRYLQSGASIMICARDEKKLTEAASKLQDFVETGQKIGVKVADISVPSEVNKFVDESLRFLGGCDILVNNAGVYGPKGNIENIDFEIWKKAIEINLYGSIMMCRALLPHFKLQKYGKIIQLSGGGATNPLPMISAYAVSKAAVVRFSETLAEEVRSFGIDVNCIAPGSLNTGMLDEILHAGPKMVGQDFYERSLKQKKNGGIPLSKGTDLALWLASDASDGITAKLISAIWDNWEEWPKHIDVLNSSDAYTLRRVVGRDRGFKLGDK